MKPAVFLSLLAAGCVSTGTASGRPDVVLHNVERSCFRDTFLQGALSDGWRLQSNGEALVTFARASRSPVAAALFGTGQGLPEERLSLVMIPQPGTRDTRVVLDGAFVSNPGTAFEQRADRRFTAEEQRAFEAMGRRAEKACAAR